MGKQNMQAAKKVLTIKNSWILPLSTFEPFEILLDFSNWLEM